MRVVSAADEIEEGYARCQSEAAAAFGDGALLVERLSPRARHIEVQIIGDGQGQVSHLGERECSLQRRHQKVVEWAPSPTLGAATRDRLTAAAVRMAAAVSYRSLGTFEFLVDSADERDFAFIEANPRPAGRAHGHGGGDGRRPRARPAADRRGRAAGRDWAGAERRAGRARVRDPDARQYGADAARRGGAPFGRDADRVRASIGPWGADRHLRLPGLHDQSQLRLAAREGDRALGVGRLRRRRGPRPRRAFGVPDRRGGDQPHVPRPRARARGLCERGDPHALGGCPRRRARGSSGRGIGAAERSGERRQQAQQGWPGRSSTRWIRSPGSTTSARARARVRPPWRVWLLVGNPRRKLWGRRTPCRFARRCRARSSRSWSPKETRSALASRCS